jgi:glycosyltransferase involved in cell wall biosynthesis
VTNQADFALAPVNKGWGDQKSKPTCARAAVIIPTLNEEKNIVEVIEKLRHLGFTNILVVDGNSKDKTAAIAKKLGVLVIKQNGYGKGDALRQAFSYYGLNGDPIVIMDADGSMNPEELFRLIETIQRGADLAKGSRFMRGGYTTDMTLMRRIGNSIFVSLANLIWSTRYTDLCYGFAAFRRDAIMKLYPHLKSNNFEIEAEMFIKAKALGLRVVEVPSVELPRRHGKSNLRAYTDGFKILRTILDGFMN